MVEKLVEVVEVVAAVAASDNNHLLGYSSHAQIYIFCTNLDVLLSLIRQLCSGDNKIYSAMDVSRVGRINVKIKKVSGRC